MIVPDKGSQITGVIAVINDIYILIMINQVRNKAVSVRLFQNNTGRTICNRRIIDYGIRIVSSDKTHIFRFRPIPGCIRDNIPVDDISVPLCNCHVISALWHIGINRVRIIRQ